MNIVAWIDVNVMFAQNWRLYMERLWVKPKHLFQQMWYE